MWWCGQHPEALWVTQGQHWLRGPHPAGAPDGQLGQASLESWGNKRKWLLTRPFQAHLMFPDDLISKCRELEGEAGGEGHCCSVITKALGFQDDLIKGT